MITISIEELKKIIIALKGIIPLNYDGMDRLVAVVNYFEEQLIISQKQKSEPEGDATDGR